MASHTRFLTVPLFQALAQDRNGDDAASLDQLLQDAPDGGIPLMGVPLRFDGERPPFRASAPTLGEATAVVLGGVRGKAAE